MREKARDLVYLDANYISLDNLRVFYWGIIIIPFFMMVMSIVSINMTGVSWKSLFPLISIAIWSLFYWIFVLIIQSKRTKKSFELRFLVNGIFGLLVSFLFWIFSVSFNIISDTPFLKFDSFLWMLFFYLLFSLVYIFAIVLCVHKGVFSLIREKSKTKAALMVSAFAGALIPVAGVIGMYISRLIRVNASINTQSLIMSILTSVVIFLPALAHINFVQYFYCKKYKILCDEYGDTTSPKLEHRIKAERVKASQKETTNKVTDTLNSESSKKRVPLIFKILIGIVATPLVFVAIVFIVFFIKAIIVNL